MLSGVSQSTQADEALTRRGGNEGSDESRRGCQEGREHDSSEPTNVKTVFRAGDPVTELLPDDAVLLGQSLGREGSCIQLDVEGRLLRGGRNVLRGKSQTGRRTLLERLGGSRNTERISVRSQKSDDKGERDLHGWLIE